MSTTQRVSPRELERVRRRVATIGQDLSPEEGWNIDTSVAQSIVGMFSRLSVREGLRLVTIAARDGIGGNGWTYALPAQSPILTAVQLEVIDSFPPAPPNDALKQVMDAIEDDGSLRSFVQASILRRELEELGAWWHGLEWSTHSLLDNGPLPRTPEVCAQGEGDFLPSEGEPAWEWHSLPPSDWRPMAHRTRDAVAVTFWTISSLSEASTSVSTWTATHLVRCTPSRPACRPSRRGRAAMSSENDAAWFCGKLLQW